MRTSSFTRRAALAAGAAVCAAMIAAPRTQAFRTFNIGGAAPSGDPSQLVPREHWDLRQFPECKVPFTYSNRFPDCVAPFTAPHGAAAGPDAADQAATQAAVDRGLAAWTNVTPSTIVLIRQPAGPVANRAFIMDNVNLIDWGGDTGTGNDRADPAPVGQNVGGNFFIIDPGNDGVLQSVAAAGDVLFMGRIGSGADNDIDTAPAGDDNWTPGINVGANRLIVNPGADGTLETFPGGDDQQVGVNINSGANGIVETLLNNYTVGGSNGLTATWFNNQTGITMEADILLTANPATLVWRIDDQDFILPRRDPARPDMFKDMVSTITHELGHAIGMAHANDNQLIGRAWGHPGELAISDGGDGLDPLTQIFVGGDDQMDAGLTAVYTGTNGVCESQAFGNDDQRIASGNGDSATAMNPAGSNWFCVRASENACLETMRGGDDTVSGGVDIAVGNDGIAGSGLTIDQIPTMNQNPNAFYGGSLEQQSLAQDDNDGCNNLYTPDMGDAPDPFTGDEMYPTKVRKMTLSGKVLNGINLLNTAPGPVVLYGYNRMGGVFRYEWLGADEDGHASECDPRLVDNDSFDDGVSAPDPLIRGAINRFVVTVTHTNYTEPCRMTPRYDAANPRKTLNFNGYLDYPADGKWVGDLQIYWRGVPGQTILKSGNWVSTVHAGNTITINYDVYVPFDAKPLFYCRYRLDYGEDESRIANINGDLGLHIRVAQFGEVEDKRCTTVISPDIPGMPDQLHCYLEGSNQVTPGEVRTIFANVERQFTGLPQQEVVLTRLSGNFNFLDGTISDDGSSTRVVTDAMGRAQCSVIANGEGECLVHGTVTGSNPGLQTFVVMQVVPASGLLGDLNGDGVVNAADLALLLGLWGTAGPAGDLNGDGAVNSGDLAMLLGAWMS